MTAGAPFGRHGGGPRGGPGDGDTADPGQTASSGASSMMPLAPEPVVSPESFDAIPHGTVAVILAAGGGSRFRESSASRNLPITHKLLAPLRGRTVFECALSNVVDAGFASIVVVTGATSLPLGNASGTMARGTVSPGPMSRGANDAGHIEVLHNERWAQGQATSLALAIETLRGRPEVDRLVVGLGDQPFIPAETWRAVALADPSAPIVVATYGGQRRNPVRLDRSVWDLVPREGDEGARPLLRSHAHLVTELACEGDPADIDTAEDLLRWS